MFDANVRRDSNLPIGEMRRKPNPSVLETSIDRYVKILNTPEVATQYMEGGDLSDLAKYARRNTAVTGYLMNAVFHGLRDASTFGGGASFNFPHDCEVRVSMTTGNFESTQSFFYSNQKTVIESSRDGTTKVSAEWTGYGASFDLNIIMEFRPVGNATMEGDVKLGFGQRVVIPPDRHRRDKYTELHFKPPPACVFAIGKVVNLLHANKHITEDELPTAAVGDGDIFPRYNSVVKGIEYALQQMGPFVDMVVGYLATLPPLRAATGRQSIVAMPWGPARHEIQAAAGVSDDGAADAAVKKEASGGDASMDDAPGAAPDVPLIGNVLGGMLDQFHAQQKIMHGTGTLGVLLQRLLLLKNYATHFYECYASIDHYMVRSFMKGIGDHNAMLFENRAPLDPLLNKIAMFQARREGIEMSRAGIDITGCSLEVQLRLPGNSHYEPLMGLPSVEPDFQGELCFGLGSKPIPVTGEYTRQLFVLPTESDGGAGTRPGFRVMAETEYKNTPVVVVVGTPDGKTTMAKTVFLLVDTWAMRLCLEIGAIPSNKKFAKAMCMLPPEMADFAKAIRACDIAEGGLDLHVIHLRPLLASALGIDEDDLMGDPDWMTQLVALMRGGVSLQSIAQTPNTEGFVEVNTPKYDLALMKTRTAKLEQQMLAQGKIDYIKKEPEPAPAPSFRPLATRSVGPCYRSMGAASYEAEEPRYTACSAGAAEAAAAPPPPTEGSVPTEAAPADAGGDASVEAIADSLKDQGLDDRDFMATLLKHAETHIPNSEAVLGATITIPDCASNCYFAKGKVPDGKNTSDFVAPGADDKWVVRPNLNAASKTLCRMLSAHAALGKPVPTTRLAVFGMFVEWETNLLTGLMSGSIDPTKTMLGAIKEFAKVQK